MVRFAELLLLSLLLASLTVWLLCTCFRVLTFDFNFIDLGNKTLTTPYHYHSTLLL